MERILNGWHEGRRRSGEDKDLFLGATTLCELINHVICLSSFTTFSAEVPEEVNLEKIHQTLILVIITLQSSVYISIYLLY